MAKKKITKISKLQFPAGGAKPGPALAAAVILINVLKRFLVNRQKNIYRT